MNFYKKFISLILVTLLFISLASGCANSNNTSSNDSKSTQYKVALILSGPISDMSWNATAYNGLKEIEKLGAKVSYQENVANSSLADSISTYANDGYNLIFLSTNSYEEIGLQVAKEFPKTQFMIINGSYTGENVVSFQIADEEQGFMMGAIAALASKSKKAGFVGGMEITPIINGMKGYEAGVKHVDGSIEVNATMTGSFDDVNKAKETAKAMIDVGVDCISPMADNASVGILEAAKEGKIYAVGSGENQEKTAPDSVLISVIKDTSIAYKVAYQQFVDKKLNGQTIKFGAKDGVVYLTDWFKPADGIDASVKTKVKDIYNELVSGKITIDLK